MTLFLSQGIVNYEIRKNNVAFLGSLFAASAGLSSTFGKTIQASLTAGDQLTVFPVIVSSPTTQYAQAVLTVNLISS
ncbi:hypothetical protein [Bacillus anthracis]|nr:hypothetical protein [Bacillus anthracis]